MESMTQAPHLLPGARAGYRLGDGTLVDSMMYDGLDLRLRPVRHGAGHRALQRRAAGSPASARTPSPPPPTRGRPPPSRTGASPTRSSRSRSPSARATRSSSTPTRACDPGTTAESLGALRPAFDKDGHHHRRQRLADLRRRGGRHRHVPGQGRRARASPPSASSSAYGQVAGPDTSLLPQPSRRHRARPWARPGWPIDDVDLFEINEAFAAVGLASADDLGIPEDEAQRERRRHRPRPPDRHVGHPAGAHRAATSCGGGAAGSPRSALCGGGGQGDAALLRCPELR